MLGGNEVEDVESFNLCDDDNENGSEEDVEMKMQSLNLHTMMMTTHLKAAIYADINSNQEMEGSFTNN